ncbi:ABC transporter ATP-binding protein [Leucobacter rhizosphaerae]|uniref:ABC transporter ATP-binding protein n=1 Tax=Leucobacter rhizosphaerae TaxID=2932245 RepID=A0ABY4FSI0_9MICO|nr:ABC transporter ATP-binding protein [Leucobacter rhizosphaerae]UOQ59197.1 ABC transporter ATP-binding protein [Leucobacter rhizosphaerae]
MSLLEVEDLRIALPINGRMVPIVEGVDLRVDRGNVLGIAGESGSGKTLTAMAVMGLLPADAEVTGSIRYEGRELTSLGEREFRKIRGNDIAMVFQDPLSSLHPMLTIEAQLTDHLRKHQGVRRAAARTRAAELLDLVRLPNPAKTLGAYPHQLSGGMRQRVAIATALACNPSLLIADEPTTALDVTVQAGIIELLLNLTREFDIGVMIVTHDLGVLSSIADRLAVFYAGEVVETAAASAVFQHPTHPYTEALLAAVPHRGDGDEIELLPMRGTPPAAGEWVEGCRFSPRCGYVEPVCRDRRPLLLEVAPGHRVACHVKGVRS